MTAPAAPNSPIRFFAANWGGLSFDGKRRYLVESGQAVDFSEASSLMSRHGAWCRKRRKEKIERRAYVATEAKKIVDAIKVVTVEQTCAGKDCKTVLAVLEIDENGARGLTPKCDQGRVGRDSYCLPCIEAMIARGEVERRAA